MTALGLRCWAWALSSFSEQGLLSSSMHGFSLQRLLSLQSMDCRRSGSVVVVRGAQLWEMDSSQTRDQTRGPCIGRWILSHWTAQEVQFSKLFKKAVLGKAGLGGSPYGMVWGQKSLWVQAQFNVLPWPTLSSPILQFYHSVYHGLRRYSQIFLYA